MSSAAHDILHPHFLAWAREAGWKRFSEVQQTSFRLIAENELDLIIGGATSSGKTEAALLPLMSRATKRKGGVSVLWIGPTKALINDQHRRLTSMTRGMDLPIHKWHGEASEHRKNKLIKNPRGVVLITPESLEGRFIRQPRQVQRLFAGVDAIVIDELHLFLSGARGHQLASLLARLDRYAPEPIRKVGISATLGSVDYAKRWLSPTRSDKVRMVAGSADGGKVLSRIRGYEAPTPKEKPIWRRRLQARERATLPAIADVLLATHRSGTHLVFAGSKKNVEMLCSHSKRMAAARSLSNRFRAHHGSMAKNERESLEEDLRLGQRLSVITTTTLEVGVDIGSVDAIDHIGAPHSLTAFRQRVGRSGRRSDPAMVTIHVTEEPEEFTFGLLDALRLNTVRAIAALNLLERKFVEPVEPDGSMLTVVLQQTLSLISENHGATFAELARLLRAVTPFQRLSERSYSRLLAEFCDAGVGLLYEAADGKYRLAAKGERLLESHEIYAVFEGCRTWDVSTRTQDVGTLMRTMHVAVGDEFCLGGKAWKAVAVHERANRIVVEPSSSGDVPYFALGSAEEVHGELAAEMLRVLADTTVPPDCDPQAAAFLEQGRAAFRAAELNSAAVVQDSEQGICHLFTWKGTRFNSVLAVLLRFLRFACDANEVAVSVSSPTSEEVVQALSGELPTLEQLSNFVESLRQGKFDKWISEALLREDWAARHSAFESELREFCSSLASLESGSDNELATGQSKPV